MASPTRQDIEQMQQNSPEYQNRQMLAQKWRGIFANQQVCQEYIGWMYTGKMETGSKDNIIPMPQDEQELAAATQAANEAITKYNESDVRNKAARKFLRRCTVLNNKFTKAQNKTVKQNIKQGYGAFDQAKVIPISNTPTDIKAAAEYAGKACATAELQYGENGSDQIVQFVDKWLNDKMYNVFFYRAYLTGIVNKTTGRGYKDDKKEAQRREILNAVSQACATYEAEMSQKPGEIPTDSGKQGLKQINDAKQTTPRYQATGGRS